MKYKFWLIVLTFPSPSEAPVITAQLFPYLLAKFLDGLIAYLNTEFMILSDLIATTPNPIAAKAHVNPLCFSAKSVMAIKFIIDYTFLLSFAFLSISVAFSMVQNNLY